MHDEQPRQVKTGGDPRSLPEFIALRDEVSKLTHPARPDVDWKKVEKLSLSLFEINGVELQTGAWYTLARSYLARVSGINEGLNILVALLNHQWAQLWPQPANARAEILDGLFQRLQKLFRTWSLSPAHFTALKLAEKRLLELDDILKRRELRHVCYLRPLLQQIRSALSRLENSPQQGEATLGTALPEQALVRENEVAPPASQLVYVIHKDPAIKGQVTAASPVKPKRRSAFVARMGIVVGLSAAIVFGLQATHRPEDATKPMAASVAWPPVPMTASQIDAFRQTDNSRTHSSMWIGRIANQVNWIMNLPPGWRLRYGQGLVAQAKALWPNDPATRALVQRWEQYQVAGTLPASQLRGWHDGMKQLHALSAKLDALDHQKGKYLTVSELKTMIWQITNSFASAVPVEEQLRQLVTVPEDVTAPGANIVQATQHLDSLIHMLEQLSAQKVNVVESGPVGETE
ncbi:MAG: VasL domain-containing protein [Leclercia adecarboxylata]|nr:VasL domain-containing protein [uncultured Leclercia sp.]MDU4843758.1 VasL domain-containing protein [Leclercia adecarboxylata]